MLKALIFDVDGTLAETEEAHRHAFNETFKAWNLNWFWDQKLYRSLLEIGGSKERIRHFASTYQPDGFELVIGQDDQAENVIKMHAEKTQHYMENVSSGQVPLRPGIERLIGEAMEAGLALAIATTTNLAPLQALFDGTLGRDMLGEFKAVAAGDMVKRKKPSPDLFLMALQKLGLDAKECLALEDSRNGLLSARGAGLATVVTVNNYTDGQDFSGALAVISDLGEKGQPFVPLAGLAREAGVADLEMVKNWHGQALSV